MAQTPQFIDVFAKEDTPEPAEQEDGLGIKSAKKANPGTYKQPLTGKVINTPVRKVRSIATPLNADRQSSKSAPGPSQKIWQELDRMEFQERSLALGRPFEPIPEEPQR